MILQNIIPTNILAALRTYIRNYVDSLQKAYLNYYDYKSGSITSFSELNTFTELMVTSVMPFSNGSLSETGGVVTNTGTTANYQISASISVTGVAADEIQFCFGKNTAASEESNQSVVMTGSGKYDSVTIQTYMALGDDETVGVYVRNVARLNDIRLGSINFTIIEV